MEKAQLCRGSAHGAATTCLNGAVDRGGSDHHRLSTAHVTAARRLPVCAASDDPASDPIIVASLPEAARHLAPAAGQGRGCRQAKIQSLPDRLFPHRHRRAAHSRGKALPVRRDRSDLEIRLRHLVEGGPSNRRACRHSRIARRRQSISETLMADPLSSDQLEKMHAYWRAANYLSVGQIYLQANPLLEAPLTLEHVKPRLLGHWGTTTGLNFLYVHLNRMIKENNV